MVEGREMLDSLKEAIAEIYQRDGGILWFLSW